MKTYEIIPIKELNAEIEIPGNKYIANRLLIIASLAKGKSILKNLPDNQDINNAINVIQKFGIKIEKNGNDLVIYGNGGELKTPNEEVNVGESGTFMRFITGFSTLIKGN
ncbi:hypothetical protein HN451_10395, partial [archaeon]|nr:hypothetical protein [archaeon]